MICHIKSCSYSICGVCNNMNDFNCDYKNYRAIGTVEECTKAVEKQESKKPVHQGCYDKDGIWHEWNGINGVPYDLCPNCNINLCTDGRFGKSKNELKYCFNCGQALLW